MPLTDKIGFEATLNLDLQEAFAYRDSISDRNEIEEYFYWFSDFMREREKEQESKGGAKLIMPTEKDERKLKGIMDSADNYRQFLSGRGFNGGTITKTNNGLRR